MCKEKGFTLIELLVVISIIALLLSILMPAFNRVKAQAQFIMCGSNLKQMGIAGSIYTTTNDGYFPYALTSICLQDEYPNYWACRWHDEDDKPKGSSQTVGRLLTYSYRFMTSMYPFGSRWRNLPVSVS